MKTAIGATVLMLPAFILIMLSIHAGAYGTGDDTQFYALASLVYIVFLGAISLAVSLIEDMKR